MSLSIPPTKNDGNAFNARYAPIIITVEFNTTKIIPITTLSYSPSSCFAFNKNPINKFN